MPSPRLQRISGCKTLAPTPDGWGRYTQNDPLEEDAYRYASSNPTAYIDPLGLYTIRNYPTIRNIPQLNILDEYCNADTGGACTGNRLAWTQCPCRCTDGGFKMDVTMNFKFTIYVFTGPWQSLKKKRKIHRSVTDRDSALSHEYAYHIDPAQRMIGEFLAAYEAPTFPTLEECDAACVELRGAIQSEFESLLGLTQRAERRGGDPRTFGR